MSFNNVPYIFSDVHGYEASKGERIVKAFQKLRAKINCLEQTKSLEKIIHSQEMQANSEADLTISNVRYELLLTQLRYIIKFLRESANYKSSNSADKDCYEMSADPDLVISANKFRPIHEDPNVQQEDKNDYPSSSPISKITAEASHHEDRERNINCHQVSSTGTQTSNKDPTEKQPPDHLKQDSHSHYHLKLNDVPFILGASATASHSVLVNVQNIIALMKNHNKALCAPKVPIQKKANSGKLHKADAQDADEMIREISEDLTKLNLKHEKLEAMFDNASPHLSDAKVETSRHLGIEGEKKCEIPIGAGQSASVRVFSKKFMQSSKSNSGNQVKHIVPTVRIQTNDNPQLARRKMLRSLKDLKTHLSEEDLSWK